MSAVVLVAAVLAGCAQSAKSHGQISLLPSPSAKGGSWDWSATCPVGPHTPSGCDAAGPEIGPAELTGDEWNLGGGPGDTGSVSMSVSPTGSLSLHGNLMNAPPCTAATCLTAQANTWVRGYPSVLYGVDQCHAATSPPQSTMLDLPARVDSIPADLVGQATYNAQAAQVTHNVAYDLWLSPSDTATPCQTDGTIEVMVWTDYTAKALLPNNLIVGTTRVPLAINGTVKSSDPTWTVYANNVYGGGHTAPWGGTIWLIPNTADTTIQGTVTVDLSAALAQVDALLQRVYSWQSFASNHWLDTIAFGMEYGPQSGDPYSGGPANFSLDISSYCLQVATTVGAETC
jgi:hypothetical protein